MCAWEKRNLRGRGTGNGFTGRAIWTLWSDRWYFGSGVLRSSVIHWIRLWRNEIDHEKKEESKSRNGLSSSRFDLAKSSRPPGRQARVFFRAGRRLARRRDVFDGGLGHDFFCAFDLVRGVTMN